MYVNHLQGMPSLFRPSKWKKAAKTVTRVTGRAVGTVYRKGVRDLAMPMAMSYFGLNKGQAAPPEPPPASENLFPSFFSQGGNKGTAQNWMPIAIGAAGLLLVGGIALSRRRK